MRCNGGLIRRFVPSQSSIPVIPPLNGYLKVLWTRVSPRYSHCAKSLRRSPNKFIRSYVAAMLERDLLDSSSGLGSIARSPALKISAIVAPDRISISQDP
jgi:hypothetical protein